MELIKLYKDGNRVCAIIGDEPEPKAVAYENTAHEALECLGVYLYQLGEDKLNLDCPGTPVKDALIASILAEVEKRMDARFERFVRNFQQNRH